MKRKNWILLSAMPVVALLGSPSVVDACMQCAPVRPICERANYSGCKTTQITSAGDMSCDEWSANCAWVLNLSEIAADGSLAFGSLSDLEADGMEQDATLRGCHGLVVARDYSEDRVARLRAESAKLAV